jgi:hypothetical protein
MPALVICPWDSHWRARWRRFRSRPQHFPASVALYRVRDCGTRYEYTRFAFRYTTNRRPPSLPPMYHEFFGC